MKRVVAIFSRDSDANYRFLSDFLKAEGLEVRSCIITNNGQKRFREEASTCHFAILYHTKNRGRLNITDVTDSLYDEEITELNTTLGKNNVVVVVDDLDCSSSEKKMEILAGQPSIHNMAAQLFLVSKADKNSEALLKEKLQQLLPHIMKKETSEKNVSRSEPNTIIIWSRGIIHGTLELFNKVINYLPIPSWCKQFIRDKIRWWVMKAGHGAIMSCFGDLVSAVCFPCAVLGLVIRYIFSMICGPSRRVVGIFSRSASEDYEWLTTSLNSAMFKNLVMESRSVYISNRDQNRFREAVQDCDFGILYHTKNHGRINITNVTDSIYDEQLELMSSSRGRVNVIVMVDDLEKSDYEEKRRIIDSQPDILKYSQDLILVSSNEKRQPQLLERKLQDIKALISAGSRGPGNFCDDLVSMTRWVSSNVDEILRRPVSMSGRRVRGELDEPLLA